MTRPQEPNPKLVDTFMAPYLQASRAYAIDKIEALVKLDQNETPWDWPKALKDKVLADVARQPWNRYPGANAEELGELLGVYLGIDPGCIITSPGSNHLVTLILSAFSQLRSGPIVVARPSFPLYEGHLKSCGIPYETWPLSADLEYDLKQMPKLTTGSLVIFASPNNPVGNVLPKKSFEELLTKHPDCFFVADEAYYEFAEEPFSDLLNQHSNLLLVRTFSKALGSAGVRLGYAIGAKSWIQHLQKLRLPYLLNVFSVCAVSALLTEPGLKEVIAKRIKENQQQRQLILNELQKSAEQGGYSVKPSQTNFLLLRWPNQQGCQNFYQKLLAQKVLIRNVSGGPGLMGCLRMTIGTEAENAIFLKAVNQIV